jgi:type I restriction enzyme, S subunit
MSDWNRTPFSQLLVDSKDGEWGEGGEAIGLREAIIIRGTDFAELDDPAADFPRRWVREHIVERKSLQPGDIILETAGGTSTQSTGRSALLKSSFFADHTEIPVLCASFSRHLRLRTAKYSPRFIYYLLQTLHRTGYIGVFNTQHTGVSRFQYTTFKNHTELQIPDLPVQRQIASILSAYDEQIDNNRRRIALLETLGDEIYREWFVRLRFPGYGKAEVAKGLPFGWQVLPFSQIVSVNPPESIDRSEERPFAGMEDLSVNSMFFTLKEARKGGQGAKFRNRDVLFPRITPSVENGKRGFVMALADEQVGLGSTEFIVLREKVIGPEHIYFLTCSSDFRKHAELSMTGASGRQRVQEDCFSFFLVKTPPTEIRLKFSEIVRPHFSQIHLLSSQIEHLTKSRDLLLPRLISGKLCVENVDVHFPPGMAEEVKAEPRASANA